MDYYTSTTFVIEDYISTCRERIFCSFLFWFAVLVGALILLFLVTVISRVILNIVNCIVIAGLHLCDKCCIANLAPVEDECTAELIELRARTLSWTKNAMGKVKALKGDYEELRKRSKKVASSVHLPGV